MVYFNPQEASRTLPMLVGSSIFELRFTGVKHEKRRFTGSATGVFSDVPQAIKSISELTDECSYRGAYFTLHECHPAILSRRPNIIDFCEKEEANVSDGDVVRMRWLPIDIDPDRPTGTPSSDAELDLAKSAARVLFKEMSVIMCAEPLVISSGNGMHLLWSISLSKTNSGWGEEPNLIKRCLASASKICIESGISGITVDQKVFNPGRVWKIPGCFSQKGCELSEQSRFYRMSQLAYAPKSLIAVSRERLEAFAGPAKADPPRRSETPLAVPREVFYPEDWLRSHGIAISHTKPWHDATAYVLEQCPFNSGHRSPDSMLLQFADGRVVFYCSHNSCRSKGWFDFREMIEPGWREKRKLAPGYGSEVQNERQRQLLRSMMREEWLLFREFSQQKGI